MITQLRPPVLDQLGLEDALHDHLDIVRQDSGLDVTIRIDLAERLDADLETVLYRVAQEALTNIVKHARAAHVWVSLSEAGNAVTLEIRDDGVGFRPEEAPTLVQDGHLGLIAMRERVETVGGTWELHPLRARERSSAPSSSGETGRSPRRRPEPSGDGSDRRRHGRGEDHHHQERRTEPQRDRRRRNPCQARVQHVSVIAADGLRHDQCGENGRRQQRDTAMTRGGSARPPAAPGRRLHAPWSPRRRRRRPSTRPPTSRLHPSKQAALAAMIGTPGGAMGIRTSATAPADQGDRPVEGTAQLGNE